MAVEYFSEAMTLMECENIERTVAEMDKVRDQAMLSYEYAIQEQKWEQAVLAKKLKIMATIVLHSAEKKTNTIIPFHVLKDNTKMTIAAVIEKDLKETLDLPNKIKSKRWLPMSDRRKEWAQNLVHEIMKPTYWPAPPTIHRGLEWPQCLNCLSVCSLFSVGKFSNSSPHPPLLARSPDNSQIQCRLPLVNISVTALTGAAHEAL